MAAGRGGAAKKKIGPYELVAELHQGYLGSAWIGRGEAGALVLARRIDATMATDSKAVKVLVEAAEWATKVDHDNIVKVIGVEQDDDEAVIASAYHEGEPLRSILRLAGITRHPMPAPIAMRIAADLLEALAQLHEQRLDDRPVIAALNPDNVLIGTDGRARVLEPGVSAAATTTGAWAEDPKRAAYDAPERLAEGVKHDQRADLFSLGVLLWEMLRNRPLFAGASYDAVSKRVQTASIRRVDSLKPAGGEAIDASVANIVAQALEREPEERFEAATEMQAAIIGEQLASAEEVAEFIEKLAGDALSKHRRKVEGAKGGADDEPAPEPAEEEKAPPPKPKPKPKKAPKQTLLGMAVPVEKPAPEPGDDEDADKSDEPDEGATPLAGTPEAAVDAEAAADSEEPAPETVEPESAEPESAEPEPVRVGDDEKKAAGEGEDDKPELPKPPVKAAAKEGASGASPAGLAASIEETLAQAAASADQADTKDKSSGLDYDVLSIADDPSMDEAPARPAKDVEERKKPFGLIVGVVMVAAVVIIAVVVLGGSETEETGTDSAKSAAPTGPASTPTATASEAAPAASASAAAAEDAGTAEEEEADAGADEEPAVEPDKPVGQPTPRPQPRPKPRPKPQPTQPKGQPKYTPGGI
ncbi:MAG: protein kinase [Deltaproteobacteria bacterium]|nr:protein kinase [Deltaproteobacteria bacterium]